MSVTERQERPTNEHGEVRLLAQHYDDTPGDGLGWDLRVWGALAAENNGEVLTIRQGLDRIVIPVDCYEQFAAELMGVAKGGSPRESTSHAGRPRA